MSKIEIDPFLLKDMLPKSKWAEINDSVGNSQLYDGLSIEFWKQMVEAVQKFEIIDGSPEECILNLTIIQNVLDKIGVCHLENGYANTECFWKIGLFTLLKQIYSISALDKKEHFAKQIETLAEIGIDTIALTTNKGSTGTIMGIENSFVYPDRNHLYFQKVYTDGTFYISNSGGYYHLYDIEGLRGDNYYLSCELTSENGKAKLWKAKAYLNNFQGVYPTKEEVLNLRQPRIVPIGEENEMLAEFLINKNLYQEYLDYLSSSIPQESMEWQVTKKRVRQVLR